MDDPTALERVFAQLPFSLTTKDVAGLLHTSERTVINALNSNKLPGHKPLGVWVIFRDELRECLEEHAEARKNPPSE